MFRSAGDIDNEYTYHAPKGDQAQRYQELREKAKELAHLINLRCPDSAERETAFQFLNLAVMSANAAIARHE